MKSIRFGRDAVAELRADVEYYNTSHPVEVIGLHIL